MCDCSADPASWGQAPTLNIPAAPPCSPPGFVLFVQLRQSLAAAAAQPKALQDARPHGSFASPTLNSERAQPPFRFRCPAGSPQAQRCLRLQLFAARRGCRLFRPAQAEAGIQFIVSAAPSLALLASYTHRAGSAGHMMRSFTALPPCTDLYRPPVCREKPLFEQQMQPRALLQFHATQMRMNLARELQKGCMMRPFGAPI
jgi:hypothetical protein